MTPLYGRNISEESLFPKGSHYLLVNNDRGSHYLLVKNDRGHFFRGVIFHGYTGNNSPAKIYIKSKRIEISPLNDVYFQIHISVSYKMSNLKEFITASYGASIYQKTSNLKETRKKMAKTKNQFIFL